MNYQEAYSKLQKYDQLHVLKYYQDLSEDQQDALLLQIETTDLNILSTCSQEESTKGKIEPLQTLELDKISAKSPEYRSIGVEAIKSGKVAAVLLAGGMGTRLGSDNPKGMYDIGLSKPVYIFERIISNLMDVVKETDTWIQLYIMTSDKNNDATINFFKQQNYFGYNSEYINFFIQDMAPATDYNGKIFMESKYKMSTSPNGNGGWFSSLYRSGLKQSVLDNGIEWFNIFAVDNVLQRIADPLFIGATIAGNHDAGAKVVRKAAPEEKVGVICLEDKKPSIIEYYEMDGTMLHQRQENGEYAYNFGVILNYLFSRTKLEEMYSKELPIHHASKKIACLDEDAGFITPEEPNGFKYETLVLDMVHQMDSCLSFEVERNREFAPIKNKTGVDSVESARILLQKNDVEL